MKGKSAKTILRGQVVFDGEQVIADPGMGQSVPGQNNSQN